MKVTLGFVIFCLCINLTGARASGEILFEEDFEGSKALSTYNGGKWTTIPNFTTSDWGNCIGILKDTSVPQSGHQCAKLYGNEGNWETSEMYTGGTLNRKEFWVSWWERLSPGYRIDTNHKWFLVSLQNKDGDYYTDFQCNNGGTDTTARMRIYSEPLDKLYGYGNMFLPTNTWYQLRVYYKLNSPGSSDGAIRTWIRIPPRQGWVPWHTFGHINIRGVVSDNVASVRLGGTRSGCPSRGIKYIDDIIIATTEKEVEKR